MTTAGTAERLRPVLWAALAVGTALATAVVGAAGGAGTAVTRAAVDATGVACVGLACVAVLLPAGRPGPLGPAVDRALVALGGGWVALVLLAVVFRAADAFGRPLGELGVAEVTAWSTELPAGRGLLLTAGCAAVVAGCATVRLRDPARVPVRIPLVAALLGVLTPTVTGHAGSEPDHQLAVVAAALHAVAAAVWVGGLGALLVLVARHRALLADVLPRFSRLAGICVVTVAVTGVVAASLRMEGWNALPSTPYGRLVLAKAAALVLLAGLGGSARRRLAAGRAPVLRWAGYEVGLMAVTLGLAAALSQTDQP